MGRVLGIDYGERRIGLALSDPMKIIAYPFRTIYNSTVENLISEFEIIIIDKDIDSIVIGLPIGLKGKDTIQTKKVRYFASTITDLGIPIQMEDERFSTISAKNSLILQRIKTVHDKAAVDRTAAAIFFSNI